MVDEYWADVNPVVLGGRQPELPVLDERIHPGLTNTHTFVSRGQFHAKPLGSERWPVTRVPLSGSQVAPPGSPCERRGRVLSFLLAPNLSARPASSESNSDDHLGVDKRFKKAA